jgi:hypothetical protein
VIIITVCCAYYDLDAIRYDRVSPHRPTSAVCTNAIDIIPFTPSTLMVRSFLFLILYEFLQVTAHHRKQLSCLAVLKLYSAGCTKKPIFPCQEPEVTRNALYALSV